MIRGHYGIRRHYLGLALTQGVDLLVRAEDAEDAVKDPGCGCHQAELTRNEHAWLPPSRPGQLEIACSLFIH